MSGYEKNSDFFGVIILLLLLKTRSPGFFGSPSFPSNPIFTGIKLDQFSKDMHRLVEMIDQMESLSQMSGLLRSSNIPALSQPDELEPVPVPVPEPEPYSILQKLTQIL